MNTQNILKYRGTKLDGVLDYSELYDYELVDTSVNIVLDTSEVYDYDLAGTMNDYVIIHEEIVVETYYLMTENGLVLTTEDNYRLRYD